MARFYGWSPDQIDEMDVFTANKFLAGMEQIECQEALLMLNLISYPHMTKEGQKKLHKSLHKRAFQAVERKPLTTEELKRFLANG